MGASSVEYQGKWYWFNTGAWRGAKNALDNGNFEAYQKKHRRGVTEIGEFWMDPKRQRFPAMQGMVTSDDSFEPPAPPPPPEPEPDPEPEPEPEAEVEEEETSSGGFFNDG